MDKPAPICEIANLPSFESRKAGSDYMGKIAPSCPINHVWQCKECLGWHFWGSAPYPAGATSGSQREQPTPERILDLIKETEIPQTV